MRSIRDMWNGSLQELLISPTGLHSSFISPPKHGRGAVRSKHDLAFIECEMNAMRLLRYLQQCSIHAVALIFHSTKIPTKTKRPPTANIPLSPKRGASSRQHQATNDFEVDDLEHQVSFISWVRKFVPPIVDDPLLSTMPSGQISCLFIRLYQSGFV